MFASETKSLFVFVCKYSPLLLLTDPCPFINLQGVPTYTPRLLAFDARGNSQMHLTCALINYLVAPHSPVHAFVFHREHNYRFGLHMHMVDHIVYSL
jgi:hypothetical protein